MKKILLAALPWTISAYAEVVSQFVDTDVDASGNLHLRCANTGQASFYDEKKWDDRLKFCKEICKYENGCGIESTDMLTGVTSEYSYEDIVNKLVSINQSIAAFTADPCS